MMARYLLADNVFTFNWPFYVSKIFAIQSGFPEIARYHVNLNTLEDFVNKLNGG